MSDPTLNPHSISQLASLHRHTGSVVPVPAGTANPQSPSTSSSLSRDYRKGNWTVHETLILITAKRLNDERRSSSRFTSSSLPIDSKPPNESSSVAQQQCRSAELRWKWVENYCWRNGCLRSQNQCNDKWDNLLRDYKKVRDYESRATAAADASPSYWSMEKHERKDRNLPSNLSSEVFHALTEVLSRRNANKTASGGSSAAVHLTPRPPPSATPLLPPPHLHHLQHPVTHKPPSPLADPPPPPKPVPLLPPPPLPPLDTGAETSGKSDSPDDDGERKGAEPDTKRQKKSRSLGASVTRGASVLARTLLACEEMREKRHREILELESRRLRMEEDRTEMSRQGIAGLIAAVNGLSGAINALVSDRQLHQRRRNDEC